MTSSPVSRRAARAVGALLLAASLSVTVTGSAPASSMLGMDLEMLSASADRILVGKVEKTESRTWLASLTAFCVLHRRRARD